MLANCPSTPHAVDQLAGRNFRASGLVTSLLSWYKVLFPVMRLLIVEDSQELGDWLARILRKSNYAVDCMQNAEDGFLAGTATKYDLLIVDFGLPAVGATADWFRSPLVLVGKCGPSTRLPKRPPMSALDHSRRFFDD